MEAFILGELAIVPIGIRQRRQSEQGSVPVPEHHQILIGEYQSYQLDQACENRPGLSLIAVLIFRKLHVDILAEDIPSRDPFALLLCPIEGVVVVH